MVAWLKDKWEILVGVIVAIFGGLAVLLRFKHISTEHKENFDNAKEAHDAELRIWRDSRHRRAEGAEKIKVESEKKIEAIKKENDANSAELAREKEGFIEDAKDSSDLARSLADAIGADFVEEPKK